MNKQSKNDMTEAEADDDESGSYDGIFDRRSIVLSARRVVASGSIASVVTQPT